ncbi:ATP-NAD kinase family protein [Vagococcus elongatus]|uniref:ATP-NAD kinase n=1 Tax=Vagococcus elongatus TaxID=180344 RepID=A0A430B5D5_9ENTE|nr:ATP-NAD kinase family protein [Vagococcus elongatus]RSU15523.1 hypothetical protein CBF29_00135 [Vagococcus elongatus]
MAAIQEEVRYRLMLIGLIVNPIAGIGGPAGLKGSDSEEIQRLAVSLGSEYRSNEKTKIALSELTEEKDQLMFLTGSGLMGEDVVKSLGFSYQILDEKKERTTSEDTLMLAKIMKEKKVDLIVFSGGDGTARDIYNAIGLSIPCVGIPAGVKIHSAVYANNPKDAGVLIKQYVNQFGESATVDCEVMDIDEEKFRQNIVDAKLYGYLKIPFARNLMQQSKASIKFSEHDLQGIADEIIERMAKKDDNTCYIFGTGGTTHTILEKLGLKGSLLGVDVVFQKNVVIKDGAERDIYEYIRGKDVILILTVIGGQGHIFGRGNQQLSPRVIREIRKENIWIVATADKLYSLHDNLLHVDTSDPDLDEELSGYWRIIVGWHEEIVCQVAV